MSALTKYYLQMDGVDDTLVFPSMTFNKVRMRVYIPSGVSGKLFTALPDSSQDTNVQITADGLDAWDYPAWNIYVDDSTTVQPSFNPRLPRDSARVVTLVGTNFLNDGNPITAVAHMFSTANGVYQVLQGRIYSVEFYNGSALQAYYDMTSGNVQDKSGNNRHATLNGGTWVESNLSYYLYMDGVDDYVITPSFTADKIVIDCVVDSGQGEIRQIANGAGGFLRVMSDDSMNNFYSSYSGFALDTRTTLTLNSSTSATGTSTIFSRNQGTYGDQCARGKIYSVKFYNGAALVAFYDMTSGNVLDQSGNGRHATLTGGTWVQDTTSGGTSGSVSYSTRQAINQSGITAAATKQIISQGGISANATKQVVSQAVLATFSTKQIINQTGSLSTATKQAIFANSAMSYATQQVIMQGGISGVISFSSKQAIYSSGADDHKTKQVLFRQTSDSFKTQQSFYAPGTILLDSKQIIYRIGVEQAASWQNIFKVAAIILPTKLSIYNVGSLNWPTAQVIYDQEKLIISRVSLLANRSLRVNLFGSRELRIEFRGDVSSMKKNQNFEMEPGESKYLDFIATDNGTSLDLTSATVLWTMKKSNSQEWSLRKDSTSGGIEITDEINGKFTVTLLSVDTKDFPSGIYYHEAYVIDATNHKSPVSSGSVTLTLGLI